MKLASTWKCELAEVRINLELADFGFEFDGVRINSKYYEVFSTSNSMGLAST